MAIEIVDFPMKHRDFPWLCQRLPEGKPPFSYGFPMVFPWFSYDFPCCYHDNGGSFSKLSQGGDQVHSVQWHHEGVAGVTKWLCMAVGKSPGHLGPRCRLCRVMPCITYPQVMTNITMEHIAIYT